MGVAIVACEATERAPFAPRDGRDFVIFFLYGLSDLCGEENFYAQV
jgi:hypothetical protein